MGMSMMGVIVSSRTRLRAAASTALPRLRGHYGGCGQDMGQGFDGFFRGLAQRLEFCATLRINLEGKAHIAVLDDEAADHAERNDVAAAIGVANATQRLENLLFGYWFGGFGHRASIPAPIAAKPAPNGDMGEDGLIAFPVSLSYKAGAARMQRPADGNPSQSTNSAQSIRSEEGD